MLVEASAGKQKLQAIEATMNEELKRNLQTTVKILNPACVFRESLGPSLPTFST